MAEPTVPGTYCEFFNAASDTGIITGVQAGETLILAALTLTSNRTVSTVTDNKGNTWQKIVSVVTTNNAYEASIWRAKNCAAGDTTATVTLSASGQCKYGIIRGNGLSTTSPDDVSSSKQESSTHPHVCAATANDIDTASDVLVVIAGVSETDRSTISATGYTLLTAGTGDTFMVIGYKTSAAALTDEQGTWTQANTAGAVAASVIASFKAGAAAAPSVGQIIWIN